MTDRPIPDETMRRAEEVLDLMCCNVPEAGNVRQASILDIARALLEAEKRGMRRGAELCEHFAQQWDMGGFDGKPNDGFNACMQARDRILAEIGEGA